MGDHLGEVVVELWEADVPVCKAVHQGKAKLVLLVFLAIAEDVHDRRELLEVEVVLSIDVEDFEHAVG